jgi:uncharacterized protein (DUF1015 family)
VRHRSAVAGRRGGLVLAPFRGVRYAPQRVTGLAEVTSPPYDVISTQAAERLLASDPHNVVRLILPREDPGGPGRYQAAGQLLRAWTTDGVLLPDPGPALYVYEQWDGGGGERGAGLQRGLIGAVRLVPPSAGIVLPHEDVVPGPVSGRRQLMEATGANLEPIFLLYDGGGPGGPGGPGGSPGGPSGSPGGAGGESASAATRLVNEVADEREPLLEVVTGDGVRHRLWAVTAPPELAMIAADLGPRQALIADGHHRYAAYREVQAARTDPGPWDYGLALLVDSSAFPPRIDPIHRVIPYLPAATAAELAKGAFSVHPLPPGTSLDSAVATLAGSARPAFLLAGDGHLHLLTDPDPVQLDEAMPPGRSQRWRGLDTSVLHQLLIRSLWRLPDDERTVRMVHHDAAAAIETARPDGTAVICNPAPAEDVLAIAAGGETVPRKTTSFGPKPRTGLVIRTFAHG